MARQVYSVTGMACDGCEEAVETEIGDLDGITNVQADHESDAVEVESDGSIDDGAVRTAIEAAGYEVV